MLSGPLPFSPLFSAVWVHLSHFRSPPRSASFLDGLLEGRGCATTFRSLNHGEQELPAFGVGRTLLTFEMPSHVKIPFNVCFSEILLKMCYLEQVLLRCVVNCSPGCLEIRKFKYIYILNNKMAVIADIILRYHC